MVTILASTLPIVIPYTTLNIFYGVWGVIDGKKLGEFNVG